MYETFPREYLEQFEPTVGLYSFQNTPNIQRVKDLWLKYHTSNPSTLCPIILPDDFNLKTRQIQETGKLFFVSHLWIKKQKSTPSFLVCILDHELTTEQFSKLKDLKAICASKNIVINLVLLSQLKTDLSQFEVFHFSQFTENSMLQMLGLV